MTELDRIRTDVVGSLLRPQAWKAARAGMEQGSLSKTEFARIELDCVRENVALQEGIGLDVVTDGEVGRLNFQDSFGLAVSGYETAAEGLAQHESRAAAGRPLARFDMPDVAGPARRWYTGVGSAPTGARENVARRFVLPALAKTAQVSLIGPDRAQR
jgi:5-methyltetrahydropteroyltriglutamate--homocysteine methyltransferase